MSPTSDIESMLFLVVAVYAVAVACAGYAVRRFAALRVHYQQVLARCGLSGRAVAERLLASCGLGEVVVTQDAMVDQYDFRRRVVQLRSDSAASASVASVATAAHEVGHACQFAEQFWAARATRWMSWLLRAMLISIPAILVWGVVEGAFFTCLSVAILVVGAAMAVLLPIVLVLECDATRRGQQLLRDQQLVVEEEWSGVQRLLRAGFLTYVVYLVGALMLLAGAFVLLPCVTMSPDTVFMPPSDVRPVPVELPPQRPGDVLGHPIAAGDSLLLDLVLGFIGPVSLMASLWWVLSRANRRSRPNEDQLSAEQVQLGMLQFRRANWEAALAHFEKAVTIQPRSANAWYHCALVYVIRDDMPQAGARLERLFALPPSATEAIRATSDLWVLRGGYRLSTNDLEGAVADFDAAVARPDAPAHAWRDRGLAWLQLGQPERALVDFDEAIQRDRSDAIAYNNRGVALAKLGEVGKAGDDFRRAILIAPEFVNPREHLARLPVISESPEPHEIFAG